MPIVEALGLPFAVTSARGALGLAIVASGHDASALRRQQPYVYVEHGAGQHYGGHPHSGYAGSLKHRDVKAFICPNESVADRWRAVYPDVPAVAVGCPYLDEWHLGRRPIPVDRTVTITFHWPCKISRHGFSDWAFPWYRSALHHVVDAWRRQGWIVLGHAHPKAVAQLAPFWDSIGVEYVPTIEEVFDRSNVLVCDNSSVIPEFMSLGRPVIMLNCPRYPKDVDIGGRFWDWARGGLQVDDVAQLFEVNLDWLCIEDEWAMERLQVVDSIYAHTDGHAAARAAEVIHRVLKEM